MVLASERQPMSKPGARRAEISRRTVQTLQNGAKLRQISGWHAAAGSAWLVHEIAKEGLMKLIGIALIVVGVLALAFGGFSYTTRERVVDIGPVKVDADKEHTMPIAPIAGVAALVGGIALVMVGAKSRV
jgi:uncharacterized membrane protein YidH (DUF202 family)